MPAKAEKHLVICIRDESYNDLVNIAKRVNRLDGSIIVSIFNGSFDTRQIPQQLRHLRLLTLYLVNPPQALPAVGHTFCVKDLGKAEECDNFAAAGVRAPRSLAFQHGMEIDSKVWGSHVILKPVHSSFGLGNLLVPTANLGELTPERIPDDHPLKTQPYLLQRYVSTGTHAISYRVLLLLGQPLMCVRTQQAGAVKLPKSLEETFTNNSFSSNAKFSEGATVNTLFELAYDEDIIEFSKNVYAVHPHLPLQGIDIIREASSGDLYALETNSGGNVWTFSRKEGLMFQVLGAKALVNQFKAWDRAAEILVAKTNELAC